MILHEKTEKEFSYTFEKASQYKNFYCVCDYCGKEFLRCKKTIKQCNQVISKDSCGVGLCKKAKSEEVQLIKYGSKNIGGTKESLEKRKQTSLEKYNAENYGASEARKKDNIEKLGVEHHTQTQEWKDGIKQANLKNRGVDHHTKDKAYQEQLRKRCQEKYGTDHFMQTDEFKTKMKNTMVKKYGDYFVATAEGRKKIINVWLKKYGKPFPVQKKFGKTQETIAQWLNSMSFNFKTNVLIIDNKEIDIYDEKLKLGIEYCGLFWHNELSLKPKNKNYHFSKYKECLDKGIRLLTIFEDEWIFRQAQCKNYIKSILGVFDKRIYARECEIKQVDKTTANQFYEDNHILGKNNIITVSFGLFYNNELLGLISLGKHHRLRLNKDEIILSRLCFKSNVQVIGGASKLFSRCINWSNNNNYTSIVSWSDNRWSDGKIYKILGFELDKELGQDYSYVNLKKHFVRLSKQSQKKTNTKCPDDITEREWCLRRGLARIWDCGKKRWIFKLSLVPS